MAAQAKAPVSRKRALSTAPPPSFEACVVTYISQDRAFQRVFAETEIEGMKNVVRQKLNLAANTGVRLAQVVEGRRIDLEDDADFCAFQLGARLKPQLQVEVSVIAAPALQLASPSVTATSINLDRVPPPLTQTGKGEAPQTADESTSITSPPKKKRKSRKSNLVIVDSNAAEKSTKPVESAERTTDEQAPKAPKSKAKAADPAPQTTTTEAAKKPKSKAKSTPPADQEAPSTSEAPKLLDDPAAEASSAPPKPKKGKKAAATTPTPVPETTPAVPTESIPETPSVDTEIPQPRSKKRGRKAAQDTEQSEPAAPEAPQSVEPPAKKQRKSKAVVAVHMSGTQSPVATTLPPPVRSGRRSSTVLSIPDPEKPVSGIGSAADILRRWGANSAATEAAPGSGAEPSTTTDADQSLETKAKAKRKRKKKDQVADDASTSTSVPAPTPSEEVQCLVCTSGTHDPTDCPLLSKRDPETAKLVEERAQHLEDTQGPARTHQMLIGSLRRWLKDTKKQVEVPNKSMTPSAVPTFQKNASPAQQTPIPTRPKKSKLSSVAVIHQSEGSSTEDEDILKSVMKSHLGSAEEDDSEDEEMADAPQLKAEPQSEPETKPQREMSPPSTPSPTPSPEPASIPLPSSSPLATKVLLQSQRMSQSSVRALLDGLESEEAGDGEKDSSDEEGSDLARSTPSDVARRRHKKSARLDVEDSEEEATARAQTQIQEEERDSDTEMHDGEDERELTTLSQLIDSAEYIPEEIVSVVGEDKGDDEEDIEEYEDEEEKGEKVVPDNAAGSPIESPDRELTAAEDEVIETAQDDEGLEPVQEDEPEPAQEEEPEPTAPAPKKRGRPPLSQLVKDERAAEKARIHAEKVATQADSSAPKKRGRPSKSKAEGEVDTNMGGEPKSNGPTTRNRSSSVGGSQESGPKPRGRPRLSDNVRAEREAEKERIRAEKAIQRLEKKTAKANAKAAAKGKGANATTPLDEGEGEGEGDEDEDATVRQSFHAPEETVESPVVPTWSTLKNPSSSRHGSSQADEIEWSATEVGEDAEGKRPSGSQSSVVKPTPDPRTRKGSAPAKPLFMPSSGLGPRFLPPLSPLTSTPAPGKLLSLSQQTPSNTLQRRRSIGPASLPRFTDIRKHHDLQQRSRKERNKLLSSQPVAFDSSQELKPKANGGTEEVVTIESSDERDSSSDEVKKSKPQSQRKRPSAFAYFDQ